MSDIREANSSKRDEKQGITRREFLQWAGATGALATLSATPFMGEKLRAISPAAAQALLVDQRNWVYTCCNMCGGQTGIKVLIGDGAVKKIEPNEFNPNSVACTSDVFAEASKTTGGRMCAKGNSAVKSLYDPDRLKTPMKRTGQRGEGKWQPITWEQAVGEVANRLTEVKAQYGAEALVWFSEDHSFTHVQVDFCDLFGTPNYHNHSNLCDVSRKVGFATVMGDERPLPDFAHSKYAILFGWNPLSAIKWIHLPQDINRGRQKGMKLVVVDPVFTHTAAKADEWVPIRPGTDGAMALAICNVLVMEKLYDQKFVDEWTVGFDKFVAFVQDKTPEWAAKITSVPAATTRRIAKELAANKPCIVDAWSGPGHHTNASQGTRAIAMIPALLGQYDKPGTMVLPDKKGNKHRKLDVEKPKAPRVDGLGTKYPFGHKSGIYVEAREAILTGKPYQPRAGVFVFQNFVMSVPNRQKNMDALKKLDFVVVVDTHLSETAELADIVVPGSHYLERYDLNSHWVSFPALGLRQPVVKSWINGMPEYEFVMALGRKMGLKDKKGVGFEMTYEQFLDEELKAGISISLEDLKRLPGAVWIGGQTKYDKYASEVKLPEGATVDEKGIAKDKDGKGIGFKKGDVVFKGFSTPSRKIEFYSAQLEAKGYDPLPTFTEPEDKPTPQYPLALVAWKQAEHTHTRTFNNEWLMEMKPDNPLWVNTEVAERMGLKDGDEVIIESPYAKARSKVKVTPGIHPEVVGLHHGYGHWALGKVAKGKGCDDGQFMPGKVDKISGQAVTKEVGVRITKV